MKKINIKEINVRVDNMIAKHKAFVEGLGGWKLLGYGLVVIPACLVVLAIANVFRAYNRVEGL